MKQKIRYLYGGAVILLGLAGSASGAMLSGDNSVNFAGSARFDTNSLASATTVESWWSTVGGAAVDGGISRVQSVEGSGFTPLIAEGDLVSMEQPWTLNSGIDNLWSVNGFQFDLTNSTIDFQSGSFLNVSGTGMITGAGFDPTPGTWFFSAQLPRADGRFSYSAGTSATPTPQQVPDGGSAVALLGLAFGGMELLRRRKLLRKTV